FEKLIREGYFYQDRTDLIPIIENWSSNYPIFLRPRRFGKSLFISTLHYYYGLENRAKFSAIFKDLYIGQNPTPLANSYLVLKLEFSRIDTKTHESTYSGFLRNVKYGVNVFMNAYSNFFTNEQREQIDTLTAPEDVVKTLFEYMTINEVPHKIYLLVDEYDHFANELLSFDLARFKTSVSRNGFVRKFYESFKTATGDGIIDRIFITGVSPITMDSLTSGFNISDNISLNPIFHDLMGFTHAETKEILRKADIETEKIANMMADLAKWYDGYQFARVNKGSLFNPDMLFYFLKEYGILNKYPDEMLDTNVVSDYRKIRNMFNIGGEEDIRLGILDELTKIGYVDFSLTRLFNLEAPFTDDDF
ncbi:MAG: AAA family ATPase, partial [Saprospiraceae bacterium]|nr:AAA family ATPase [Saprospiraceae bacterium]